MSGGRLRLEADLTGSPSGLSCRRRDGIFVDWGEASVWKDSVVRAGSGD